MVGAWLAMFSAFGSTVAGYNALGAFIIREMVWIATMLAMLFLLTSFIDELFPALASPDGRVGRLL
jgi:potassium efflux system protein